MLGRRSLCLCVRAHTCVASRPIRRVIWDKNILFGTWYRSSEQFAPVYGSANILYVHICLYCIRKMRNIWCETKFSVVIIFCMEKGIYSDLLAKFCLWETLLRPKAITLLIISTEICHIKYPFYLDFMRRIYRNEFSWLGQVAGCVLCMCMCVHFPKIDHIKQDDRVSNSINWKDEKMKMKNVFGLKSRKVWFYIFA